MNTTEITPQEKALPQLVKKSSTYKMVIPKKVEKKIRYLLQKFPATEWSGVLFTTHEGNFEDNNLVITCQDIYPMDLGTSTFTKFRMDEDVAAYMANNIELFSCDCQLIHSHHNMAAFFSGTDLNTLREEGNERNCFVSLIVNNEGTYCAAITRKVQSKSELIVKSSEKSYQFFGEGIRSLEKKEVQDTPRVYSHEVIEYFTLDIEREAVESPFTDLDQRFDEIARKKVAVVSSIVNKAVNQNYEYYDEDDSNSIYRRDFPHPSEKTTQLTFWPEQNPTDTPATRTVARDAVAKIITCSLLSNGSMSVKSWVESSMEEIYENLFIDKHDFTAWAEGAVDFILCNYVWNNWPVACDDPVGEAAVLILEELRALPANPYIDEYIEMIEEYCNIQ